MVSSIRCFPLIPRSSQRSVEVGHWNHPLSPNHTNNGLIFPYVVLHLLLNVRVVFQQVLEVFLAVEQVLLQLGVLVSVVLVDFVDLRAVSTHFGQFFGTFSDGLIQFFYVEEGILMTALSYAYFSFYILSKLALCLVSLRVFSFWYSS